MALCVKCDWLNIWYQICGQSRENRLLFSVVPNWTDETVNTRATTNSTITITWQQIRNLPTVPDGYYMYLLDYRTGSGSYRRGPDVSHDPSSDSNTATVTDLVYNTEYVIRVSPYRTMRSDTEYGRSYDTFNVKTNCNGESNTLTLLRNVALTCSKGKFCRAKWKVFASATSLSQGNCTANMLAWTRPGSRLLSGTL